YVVEPPADVALPQVPPRCPPGDQLVVVGMEGTADIDEIVGEDGFEKRSFLRELTKRPWFALLGMYVALGSGDIEVTAQDRGPSCVAQFARVDLQRFEKTHFGREVFAAVRDVQRQHSEVGQVDRNGAMFEVERRVREARTIGRQPLADVKGHA